MCNQIIFWSCVFSINKNVTEEEIEKTAKIAFEGGYTHIKLYFMMGLPGETMDDIKGIVDTAQKIIDIFWSMPNRPKGKPEVSISVATFIPKPFTPFQFFGQNDGELIKEKQAYLPVDLKRRYTLASLNYMLKNLGCSGIFRYTELLEDNLGKDVDILASYIANVLHGRIGKQFAEVEGRIVMK